MQIPNAIRVYGFKHFMAAVLAVASTGNYRPDDLAKAGVAALLPPIMRWANSKDPAFGRDSTS